MVFGSPTPSRGWPTETNCHELGRSLQRLPAQPKVNITATFQSNLATEAPVDTSIWPATLAYAARAIVFGQNENGVSVGTETWKDGDAIGLTTVNGGFPIDLSDPQPTFFLLHPAIADLEVARAAVFLDASPEILSAMAPTVDPLMEKLGGSSAREILNKWRKDLNGWYKFLDVPTVVFRDNLGVVSAMRTGPGSEKYGADILKRAFIDTQGFRRGSLDPDTPEFYSIVPYLALLSPEIAQMNALSELLSIVRWCKLSGLTRIEGKIVPARQQGPVGSMKMASLGNGKLLISYGPPRLRDGARRQDPRGAKNVEAIVD